MQQVPDKVSAGNYELNFCPNCMTEGTNDVSNVHSDWALRMQCPNRKCLKQWYVCTKCGNVKKHFTTMAQMSRHATSQHRSNGPSLASLAKKARKTNVDDQSPPTAASKPILLNEPTVAMVTDNPSDNTNPSTEYMVRSESKNLFSNSHSLSYNPSQYLLCKAVDMEETKNVSPDDIDALKTMSKLVFSLSRNQLESFANVMVKMDCCLRRQEREQLTGKPSPFVPITFPKKANDVRRTFLTGKHSLRNNLPHPHVHTTEEHSYCLPSDCVADFLAHPVSNQNSAQKLHPVEPIYQCFLATEIKKQNQKSGRKTVLLSFWSDDFEPQYSKTNRGSVWIDLMSIMTEEKKNITSHNVYPVAVGDKDSDHQQVLRILLDDVNRLRLGSCVMYDGSSKKNVSVAVSIININPDSPEKRDLLMLLKGGRGYHSRFGWSYNVGEDSQKMKSCSNCFKYLKDAIRSGGKKISCCSQCYNFWSENKMQQAPPDDFPLEEIDNNNSMIRCFRLNFKTIQKAVDKVHEKIVSDGWNKKTAMAYLNVYCLNTNAKNSIIERAQNCQKKNKALEENNQQLLSNIQILEKENPDYFQQWKLPAYYNCGVDIEQFSEPTMHLLFHGLCKSVIMQIQEWATLNHSYNSLRKIMSPKLESIMQLSLSWCKCQPVRGERLGGWVHENYLAVARLLPWIYENLSSLQRDVVDPPNKPVSKWTIQDCKNFLRYRKTNIKENISTVTKVSELRQCVIKYKDVPIAPPCGGPSKNVTLMMVALHTVISFFMGMSTTDQYKDTEELGYNIIRYFLSVTALYEENAMSQMGRSIPLWVEKYNFQSLLNVPENVKLLGPVRNRWEGGISGEGYLRFVKPYVAKGRKNWKRNLMQNLLQKKAMDNINKEIDSEDSSSEEESETTKQPANNYVVYGTYYHIMRNLNNNEPISGVEIDGQMYAVIRHEGEDKITEITKESETSTDIDGLFYFNLQIKNMLEKKTIKPNRCLLLLPSSTNSGMYSIITTDWCTWNSEGDLCQPYLLI